MALSEEFLTELRVRNDIEQVISSYVVLKRHGKHLTGLCPFHNEKTPSLTVFSDTSSFYCFGCGAGGDVISFIKKIENLDYIESVKLLCERSGMKMPENSYDDRAAKLRTRIYELNREAAGYYHAILTGPEGRAGYEYLTRRGISDRIIKRFGIGFAKDSWDGVTNYLKSRGYTENEIVFSDLARRGKKGRAYDLMRARVIFPIIDLRGNVVAFSGRNLTGEKPKYINSQDTPVFKKGDILFGMNLAKNSSEERIILTEGPVDTISLHQAGFDSAVASQGTALTQEQVRLIAKYAKEVVISYDGDDAGKRAMRRAAAMFDEVGIKTRILTVTGAKDPDEYIRKYGSERFKLLLEESSGAFDYALSDAKSHYNITSDDGKLGYLNEAVALICKQKNPMERDIYASRLANETGTSREAIAQRIKEITQKQTRFVRKKQKTTLSDTQNTYLRGASILKPAPAERQIVALLLLHPDISKRLPTELSGQSFKNKIIGNIFDMILSRIEKSQPLELISFSGEATDEEMAMLSRILAENDRVPASPDSADELAENILKKGTHPSDDDIGKMSDEELAQMISKMSQGKK